MTQKNQEKLERKSKRKMWYGYYERKTPTKKEKLERIERKYRKEI
jgi:hypothetical protein